MSKVVEFRWGVSRGRDTYGYNICSCYVDGRKVSSCNGGGYDMQGTAFADALCKLYQDRLWAIRGDAASAYYVRKVKGQPNDYPKVMTSPNARKFYGMTARYDDAQLFTGTIHIDGACGMSSVEKIGRAIGLSLKFVSRRGDNVTYLMDDSGKF